MQYTSDRNEVKYGHSSYPTSIKGARANQVAHDTFIRTTQNPNGSLGHRATRAMYTTITAALWKCLHYGVI
jgi:hypothetical protein